MANVISETSRFGGVTWSRRDGRWLASVRQLGAPKTVGKYDTEDLAARAQDAYVFTNGLEDVVLFIYSHD